MPKNGSRRAAKGDRGGLSRREFLGAAGLAAVGLALPRGMLAIPGSRPNRKPNIIVILADDLGYADLGCQGCKDIPTPKIDSLAKNGVRFTDAYVSCPVCSPTRAGLMTGRYQQRFGHEFNPGPAKTASATFGLPKTEKTIADLLGAEGYATGIVGKWHLGYRPGFRPLDRGFDEFFGFLGGAHSYIDPGLGTQNAILRGNNPVDEKEYLTDAFTREAVAFISKHKSEPFFLYLPYNAVHTPMQASTKREDRFSKIEDKKRKTFATMLAEMDDGVGRILDELHKHELEENTLVVFLSDNGGPTKANTSRNDPLNGHKAQVAEGGIRVPFLIQWKGRVPRRKVYKEPVISLDILPTAIAAAGAKPSPDAKLDGVDLIPYLTGDKSGEPHEKLFWRFGAQQAVRAGDWKLSKQGAGQPKLFNLSTDIGEKTDLADKEPGKVKELEAAYKAWNSELKAPLWGGNARARRRQGGGNS
jgi:arylsulfatase A-like enzyme